MASSPPFRADHVGSFLRPPELLEARRLKEQGALDATGLRAIEDRAIREVVKRQEDAGLLGITDGEMRRMFFHLDFLEKLDGVRVEHGEYFAKFRRDDGTEVGFKPPTIHVSAKIAARRPIQGVDFDFLRAAVGESSVPKVCIPSPSMLHFRGGRKAISEAIYPELDAFYADLAAAYRVELADLAARGCRYVQLDDTNLAYLCDPQIRESTRARGDDPNLLVHTYCRLVNDAIRERPRGMTVAVHLCRGNFRSAWLAQGGYEPVAEIMFQTLAVDAFFLEYDDERSGDFAPLRFVPKEKRVVLGLMSSKHPAVEAVDGVRARIDEAGRFIDLDQCALSHQCGFSSTVHGNELEAEDQWRKIERCVEIARAVWGSGS